MRLSGHRGLQWASLRFSGHRALQRASLKLSGHLIETCITVHLQHMTTIPQEPTPQQPINNNSLPTMWRLESMNTYTGTDGTYWRLLDHSQMGDTLQLILDIVICEVD
ncbi:mCG1148, isoform CRA_a [Mus musculus]|uniref:T-cell leukemia protein Tcl1b3a n=1 Tax=Mus musculus TaxID=10090 RepID=Q9QXN9_MOUSE|nr:T-cell leukemia protein Tcl1b3a [Mus musculus]EDL18767.1 mCG1148, isoform CRA_a [Mus musculus]